jgi:hypothetical protein
MTLKPILAQAYHTDQVERNRAGAVGGLKAAFNANPMLKVAAQEEQTALKAVIAVRTRQRTHCHISSVMVELLTAALAP